jgi:hypothetical protein
LVNGVSQGEAPSEFNNRFGKVSSNPFGIALKLLAFRHVVSHLVPHRPFMPRLGLILHWTGAENGLALAPPYSRAMGSTLPVVTANSLLSVQFRRQRHQQLG